MPATTSGPTDYLRRNMRIELQRATVPDDIKEEPCGICGIPFRIGGRTGQSRDLAVKRGGYAAAGYACESCIEYLSRRNPERFPSPGLYRKMRVGTDIRYGLG